MLYFFKPAFNFMLKNYSRLTFFNKKGINKKNNFLVFFNFSFIIDVNNLTKYFEFISNYITLEEKRKIIEKILNSDSLTIDYKYCKILFDYIVENPAEIKFLNSLFKIGLLNLV